MHGSLWKSIVPGAVGGLAAAYVTHQATSQTVFDHQLTAVEKKWAGPVVHAVRLAADEVGVPAARLGPSPAETPASCHLKVLASHVVYGFTTDLTRRALRRTVNQ